jgi:hypothetical protein
MHSLEAEIKDAIGLGLTQVEPEPVDQSEPEQEVTIYDFGKLMEWSDNSSTGASYGGNSQG